MPTAVIDSRGRSSEERRALRAQMDELNSYARDHWEDPDFHREIAAELTTTIYRGFDHENLLQLMTTVENAGFNDRVFVSEVRGLRAFWVARGGYIETSELNKDVMEMPRDQIGFHVQEFEDKLLVNFAETQQTLIDLSIKRMDAAVNQMMFATFQAAIPSTSPYYLSANGVSLATLNTAIRESRDQVYNGDLTIVGRATMVHKIMDAIAGTNSNGAGFLPETNEALVQRGVLGQYRGARIVTLKNWLDDTDTSFFPANELWVMGTDASKFAFFGTLQGKEWVEDEADYWHYRARRDCGFIVHRPDRARRIIDTSQTP